MAVGKKSNTPDHQSTLPEDGQSPQDLDARRRKLEAALLQKGMLKKPEEDKKDVGSPTGVQQAVKLSSEFLAAVVVGAVLGIGLDQLAGISPWGLIVFLLLGFAAGVLNVLRSVGLAEPSQVGMRGSLPENHEAERPKDDEADRPE